MYPEKNFAKKLLKNLAGQKLCLPLQHRNQINNLITFTIMATKKTTRANSAKKENAKRVNNTNTRSMEQQAEAIHAVEVDSVPAAAFPVVSDTSNGKVSSKEVLKAAGSLRKAVKEERRGANCTIRLIAERAASGDASAVDVLCALCDVPRAALFSLNVDTIRAAVNSWYPFYVEEDGRKVSVKPVGFWYSTELPQVGKVKVNEAIEDAAKRVQRGYVATAVTDYLDQLIKAAKSRAKGVQPRRVDAEAIYKCIELAEVADGITAAEIDEAKKRRSYSPNAANVWHKDRNGFYI